MKGGRVVFATSNLPTDRLGEVLLRAGKITPAQNDASIKGLAQGRRQGRVLVEMGALTPEGLWSGVQSQVREIVFSVFQWDEGQFHFEESVLPEKERITLDLDVTALVLEGMRRTDASSTRTSCSSTGRRRPTACCRRGRRTCCRSSTARRRCWS
jgi:two-component system, OmpR family, response regulator